MKRLFLLLIIPFIIGIFISYYINFDAATIVITLILLIAGLVTTFVLDKGYVLVLIVLFIFLGMLVTANDLRSDLVNFTNRSLILDGVIERKNISDSEKSTYIVEVNEILCNGKRFEVKEKVLLNYYDREVLEVGNKIRVISTLLLPRENTNPGLFDYRLHLQTKDIHTIVNSDSNSVYIISKNNVNSGQKLRFSFQNKITNIMNKSLSEKNSKIMSSIILGNSGFLDDETRTSFKDIGLSHILAVSGLHIGIIYIFISKLLRLLGIDKRLSIIIALAIIWIYAYLIGFPTSVLRASTMFSLLSLSNLIYKRYDSINTLSFAALLLLLIRPMWIFDIGFQLSFIATASIIILTPRISLLMSIHSEILARLLSSLIAVQIGLFPILTQHFNSYATMSLISNFILIPIFSFSLVLCFILILVSLICIDASFVLGYLLNTILNISNLIIDAFCEIPFGNLNLPSLGVCFILLYYILLLFGLRIIKFDFSRYRISKVIFTYLIIAILVSFFSVISYNETTLEFIDVGQGDSCLVSTKDKTILIDAGGNVFGDFDVGGRVVLPFLIKKGINKLDAVFVTHFHEDHAEGVISLLENIKIDNIFIGYENVESKLFNEIMHQANLTNTEVSKVYRNNLIYLDDHNLFEVLSPTFDMYKDTMSDENNLSLVLNFITHGKRVLFTGDIERESEYNIVNNTKLEKIDIIKAPHHGSSTSSTTELISVTRPSLVVIQVGKNSFGHPNEEVVNRYKEIGAKVFRNDENGLITIRINDSNIEIDTYIKDKPTINDIIMKYRHEIYALFIYTFASICMCYIYRHFYIMSLP